MARVDNLHNFLEDVADIIKEKNQITEDTITPADFDTLISDISTEPQQPFGVKVYKTVEIPASQPDLVNYYVEHISSGDINNVLAYAIEFQLYYDLYGVPLRPQLRIVGTEPAIISIVHNTNVTTHEYLFDPTYTQLYINMAKQLGVYDYYIKSFLDNHGITENQLLELNGWYDTHLNKLSTNLVISECRASKILVVPFMDMIAGGGYEVENFKDYIGFDKISLNTIIEEFEDADEAEALMDKLSGDFAEGFANPAQMTDVLSGKKYINGILMTGSMPNNGALSYTPSNSQQTIPRGYTSGGTIAAVTAAADANIIASNIKKDVNILGVTGTYDGGVSEALGGEY